MYRVEQWHKNRKHRNDKEDMHSWLNSCTNIHVFYTYAQSQNKDSFHPIIVLASVAGRQTPLLVCIKDESPVYSTQTSPGRQSQLFDNNEPWQPSPSLLYLWHDMNSPKTSGTAVPQHWSCGQSTFDEQPSTCNIAQYHVLSHIN